MALHASLAIRTSVRLGIQDFEFTCEVDEVEFAIALNASRAILATSIYRDDQMGPRRVLVDVVGERGTVLPGSAPKAGNREV